MSLKNPLLQSQEPTYYDITLPSKGITYLSNNTLDYLMLSKDNVIETLNLSNNQLSSITYDDDLELTYPNMVSINLENNELLNIMCIKKWDK